MERYIKVSGARENNLCNIDVEIPHGKHTVITGVSGSGKTTLAYHVIYAVGQKRLMDCLSEQAKRLTIQLKQPDVNYIEGLTPVISLKQYKPNKNPRATVGTVSEISTYIRNLYSLAAEAFCPVCGKSYSICTLNQIINYIKSLPEETILEISYPVYKERNKKYDDFFSSLRSAGYQKIYIDEKYYNLNDWITIDETPSNMFVLEGYVKVKKELIRSDVKLLQKAVLLGEGFLRIKIKDDFVREKNNWFYEKYSCSKHYIFTLDILPSYFNINDLNSSCKECHGTGISKKTSPLTMLQDKHKSLQKGPFHSIFYNPKQPFWYMLMYSMAQYYKFSFTDPFEELSEYAQNLVYYGTNGETFPLLRPEGYDKQMPGYTPKEGEEVSFEGFVTRMDRYYRNKENTELTKSEEEAFNKYMLDEVCKSCEGTRLKPQRKYIKLYGLSYSELENLELYELKTLLNNITIREEKQDALTPIINEIKKRIEDLIDIGLGYLTLGRRIDTLSGGEYQRVRLSGQLGSGLTGLTYIIDEPTSGLHSADTEKISNIISKFIEGNNTVITIEHDIDIIKKADYIIEMGPKSGINGGKIIAEGSIDNIISNPNSIIATYLKKKYTHNKRKQISDSNSKLCIIGASANNLKNINVEIPLHKFICITGVSGSGKSSLAIETLYKAIWSKLYDSSVIPGKYERIEGIEFIKNVYCVDQKPINKAKTSIPASYIGIMDKIREVFAYSKEAITYGLNDISYFSYNAKGKCPTCNGLGYLETHIQYLGDMKIICSECNGGRYLNEILDVKYKGKNISEVLKMNFDEALEFFYDIPYLKNKIKNVYDLGLGYLSLGQPINTISGGEAKRLKLAKEISKNRGKKDMLYILDEPTTGLHIKDIDNLISCIQGIVNKGNTVLVIEHNPYIIQNADYIIDIGPGAGSKGGNVVVSGIYEELMKCEESITAKYLREN